MNKYSIAIVGAGLSGLATAAFLKASDHNPVIYEQFDQPKPIGAGLMLQPTGLTVLYQLDLLEKAVHYGTRINAIKSSNTKGQIIFDIEYDALTPNLFSLGIHRSALFDLLYGKCSDLKIPIVTAKNIVSANIRNSQRYISTVNDQEFGPFDLVIDASGAKSTLRNTYGNLLQSNQYKFGALWCLVENRMNNEQKTALVQRYHKAENMVGLLPIGRSSSSLINHSAFFWSMPLRDYASWQRSSINSWKNDLLKIWPEIGWVIDQIESHEQFVLADYYDTRLVSWECEKMLFIGDAGHCMSPQLGQGANLGLLDSSIISNLLAQTNTIDEALRAFSLERKRHIRFYQFASKMLTPFFQSENKMLPFIRDLTFLPAQRISFISKYFMSVLLGYRSGIFSELDAIYWSIENRK